MSKRELAKVLKLRLTEKFLRERQPNSISVADNRFLRDLKNLSDENVIAGYQKCSVCGRTNVSLRCAVEIAQDCRTAEE